MCFKLWQNVLLLSSSESCSKVVMYCHVSTIAKTMRNSFFDKLEHYYKFMLFDDTLINNAFVVAVCFLVLMCGLLFHLPRCGGNKALLKFSIMWYHLLLNNRDSPSSFTSGNI
ncbi:hypothetical protein ABZP36_012270 [Zizania latifolia]